MRFKYPKNTDKIFWTRHAVEKMIYYRLSENNIKRVLSRSKRKELGIAPKTVAAMIPAGSIKNPTEIWVMYQRKFKMQKPKVKMKESKIQDNKNSQIKIITVWRYPGKSPINEPPPMPEDIVFE